MVHHRRGLRRLLRDEALLERIDQEPLSAGLSEPREAMLRFALELTRDPKSCRTAGIGTLRSAGFADADILGIVEVTAYYAYVNRIADGLGVELEPEG